MKNSMSIFVLKSKVWNSHSNTMLIKYLKLFKSQMMECSNVCFKTGQESDIAYVKWYTVSAPSSTQEMFEHFFLFHR